LAKSSRTRTFTSIVPLRISGLALALSACLALTPISLESADANGDTRTLSITNVHTNESGTVTFKRNGYYDPEALKQLSWLLRDWRRDEPTSMSPRLFDILWEVHQESGSNESFHAVSGYRSPETNAMLRRSSRAVAEHSQHMLGKAMDSYLPDVPVARMREIAMRLQRGGVGYYPTAGSPFVHIDAGSVRAWPRMTRDQLARLFPDGKTVHLPADGHPFAGYEQAKAEILAAGGTVAGLSTYADSDLPMGSGRHKSLWAALFGGADDDEDSQMAAGSRGATSRSVASRQVASLAPIRNDDDSAHGVLMAEMQGQFNAQPPAPAPEPARGRRGATTRTTPPAAQPKTTVAEQPKTTVVASAAPTPGFGTFLGTSQPEAAAGTPASSGTTVATRSDSPTASGMTIAMRSDPKANEPKADQDAAPATSTVAAFAPLPPRRPKTLAEVAALADIPLPPMRPTGFDTAEHALALATPASPEVQSDANETGKLVALDHPLPPLRSQVLPPETMSDIAAVSAAKADAATQDNAAAAVNKSDAARIDLPPQVVRLDHPLPPARPIQFAAITTAPATSGSPNSLVRIAQAPDNTAGPVIDRDKESLKALFDAAALVPARHPAVAPVKVANAVVHAALPRATQEIIIQPTTAAGHFQTTPTSTPVLNRFSGKAVEPLNTLGFTTTQ
jgi:uncharacterized protein YcbK (DUF882 family)